MDSVFDVVLGDKFLSKLSAHHSFLRIIKVKAGIILGKLEKDICIVDFREDTLFLETTNPLWVSEIRRYQNMIISRIHSVLHEALSKNEELKKIYEKKYSKKPFISKIKVNITKRVVGIQSRENIASKERKMTSLQELIQLENKNKIERGYHFCKKCGDILTEQECCSFCRCV